MLVNGAVAHAASKLSWDGTWAGTLNNEPVSVTIAAGKVVGYTIRGFSPLPIESASVSGHSVSLVIGAAYTLWLVKRVIFGPVTSPRVAALKDLNGREYVVLSALAVAVLLVGVWPAPLLKVMQPTIPHLVSQAIATKL